MRALLFLILLSFGAGCTHMMGDSLLPDNRNVEQVLVEYQNNPDIDVIYNEDRFLLAYVDESPDERTLIVLVSNDGENWNNHFRQTLSANAIGKPKFIVYQTVFVSIDGKLIHII